MKSRHLLLVLVAGLGGCKSGGAEPPPVAQAEPQAVPALPIIPHKEVQAETPAPAVADSREARLDAITKEEADAMDAYYAAIQKALGDNGNPSQEDWQKIEETVKAPDMNEAFVIVGINSDTDLEKLKDVRAKENISWRSFGNGPEGTSGPIASTWNVQGWPTLYILDAAGTIRYKSVGANEEAIDKALEELLAETKSKQPATGEK